MLGVFIYSQVAFFFLNPDHFLGSIGMDQHSESTCYSVATCWIFTFTMGPRSSGGIGDMMIDPTYKNKSQYYFRFLYDLSFFIIINIILMNIVFGIIIDTFSSKIFFLKEKSAKKRK
jgi:hypothetical protein